MSYPEPRLTKHPDDTDRDHKPMTWERLLLLRAWARWIAWREQCTVALVGSVLEKTAPRDVDVALIWPTEVFQARFGPLPSSQEDFSRFYRHWPYRMAQHALYISGQELVGWETRIDVRLCPDCWWPEKDRLILATPTDVEPPKSWNGVEFIVRTVVRSGEEEGAQ